MVLAILFGGISLLLVAAGALCTVEALSYQESHRAAVPWHWRAYLVSAALATITGVFLLAWTVIEGVPLWGYSALIGGLALFLTLVQYRMHHVLGLERSPLWARFE